MKRKYVIISLKHGSADCLVFWKANDCGYTTNPFQAGLYDEQQVLDNLGYYNDGCLTLAVPIDSPFLSFKSPSRNNLELRCIVNGEVLEAFCKAQGNLNSFLEFYKDQITQW